MNVGCSFDLSNDDVDIWVFSTTAPELSLGPLKRVLDAQELRRAADFRTTPLQDSFIVSHGVLRYLLGRYLRFDPAALRFVHGPRGKPAVESAEGIQFNLAHSGSLAAIAVSKGCAIGLDLELVRPLTEMGEIAGQFFCTEEAEEILALAATERQRAFYHCWTRKEAYGKATGDGLSIPLNSFRVTLAPGQPVRLIHVGHDPEAAKAWSLHHLDLADDYAAAVAYKGSRRSIRIFPIDDPSSLDFG